MRDRLDANGDGDFTDAADRDEPAANNTFSKANEWTARRVQKAGTGNYESYSYTHDAVGNLTAQQVDTYANNVLSATGGRRLVYDAFGRLTRVEQLVGGLGEDRIEQYKFNGLGYRIMTQTDADFDGVFEDGERTYLMYDERWRVVASFVDASATPREAWVYHSAGLGGLAGRARARCLCHRVMEGAS